MTKKELIDTIATRSGVNKKDAGACLDALTGITTDVLGRGGEIALPDIGKLSVLATQERECRNPQTGAMILVAAGKRVKFKAFKPLKDAL